MQIERRGAVALVHLRAGKANAMTREMLAALVTLFDEVESSDARAVVLTGSGGSFSAGLALPTLVGLDRAAMRAFIEHFGAAMLRVFRCPLPVVAAIGGHAIAGGCVLALQCDARIAADGASKIGLNETRLGIGLPASVVEPLRLVVPPSSWVRVALLGQLFAPSEAMRAGLVDEVVPADELLARALAYAEILGDAPRAGLAQVKAALRRPALEAMVLHADEERERWLDTWFADDAQARLKEVAARLSHKPGA